MSTEKITAAKTSIDCISNDKVNIQYGGPKYLGFDFIVSPDDAIVYGRFY